MKATLIASAEFMEPSPAFKFDLVQAIFGSWAPALASVVYIVVGLAAIYQITTWKSIQRRWREIDIPVNYEPALAPVKD